jgi:hypothetical protein
VENILQSMRKLALESKQEQFSILLLFAGIQIHLPIRSDRNTFPAPRTALFLSGLGSLPSDFVSGVLFEMSQVFDRIESRSV